jgi:DNA-binding FadR family transcriptional regulator
MSRSRDSFDQLSDFLQYLARSTHKECDRLPALADLSQELGIGISGLREQLEVARAFGLVEVKPKTGIRCLPYTFRPAVEKSLAYAISVDQDNFLHYADFRNHVETAFWYEAVSLLTIEDHETLRALVKRAMDKLNRSPIQIPHLEHRELHLTIYRRLDNPFVIGILEAYWHVYEAAGYDVYTDLAYLQKVWHYHEKIVESICAGNYTVGYQAQVEHVDLLLQRSSPISRQKFE